MKAKTRRCSRCKKTKPLICFNKGARYYNSWCRDCKSAYCKAYNATHEKERKAYKRARHEATPWTVLAYCRRKARDRSKGRANLVSMAELKALYLSQRGKCAISGIKMAWVNDTGRPLPNSISIDRKNPTGAYDIKNIRLVCYAINSFRQSMPDKDMVKMAKAIVAYNQRRL